MKVLLVGFKLNIGNELYMKMLAKNLRDNGVETTICGDETYVNKYSDGCAISKGGNPVQMVKDTLSLRNYVEYVEVLKKEKPDVIFFVSSHTLNNIAIILAKVFSSRSVIVSQVHDPLPHSGTSYGSIIFVSQFVQSWLSKYIIVAGKSLKNTVARYYLQKGKNIHVVPLGTHRREIVKPRSEKPIYISILGRIEDYKGVDIFLQSAQQVIKKMQNSGTLFKFLIGGIGNLDKYQPLIDVIPAQYLEIRNYMLSDDEFDDILAKSYVCVLPYKDATQTGTTQIAYYNSCPVIVTRVGSLAELVEEQVTGFVIEPNNKEELSKYIVEILSDQSLQEVLAKNSFEYYQENLKWSKIINILTKLFNEWRE